MPNLSFSDWQVQQNQNPAFITESWGLELSYQVARLRLLRGMTQAELAEKVGTQLHSIARLENGSSMPGLSFLERIAEALDAQVEIKIIPKALQP